MAVSTGSFTVGSSADYSTWSLALADIANLTGDLTFTQISATTDTAVATVTEDLSSNTLLFTSDSDPLGSPNGGHLATTKTGAGMFFDIQAEGPGNLTIEKLRIFDDSVVPGGSYLIRTIAVTTEGNFTYRNLVLDCNSGTSAYGIGVLDNTPIVKIFNCKFWGHASYGVNGNAVNASSIFENLTADGGLSSYALTNNSFTVRNCVGINTSGAVFLSKTNMTGEFNAADDTTATSGWASETGNIDSITPADEFASLTDTENDYLDIKTNAPNIKGKGGTPGIAANTAGIEGNPRPHGADVSIGCHEFAESGLSAWGFMRQVYEKEEFNN